MNRAARRWWLRGAAAAACVAVFLAYLQPTLIVELGNRLWACF